MEMDDAANANAALDGPAGVGVAVAAPSDLTGGGEVSTKETRRACTAKNGVNDGSNAASVADAPAADADAEEEEAEEEVVVVVVVVGDGVNNACTNKVRGT